jgi:hypothetical protein
MTFFFLPPQDTNANSEIKTKIRQNTRFMKASIENLTSTIIKISNKKARTVENKTPAFKAPFNLDLLSLVPIIPRFCFFT